MADVIFCKMVAKWFGIIMCIIWLLILFTL